MLKRFLDILLALIGMVMVAPLMFLSTILVRLDSAGPVFFKQKRVGRGNRIFHIYKFRTMVENAEVLGPSITTKNDPRVTQIGRILRWLKLDELPQFFNVLKGDMSFVGPRPEVPHIVATYTDEQKKVLTVRPGIIGPSQVTNRDEEAMLPENENVESFYVQNILPKKLERDQTYIRNKDPFKDLKILLGGSVFVFLSSIKINYILESRRRILFLVFDLAISAFSFWGGFMLRFEGAIQAKEYQMFWDMLPFVFILRAPCYIYFGLYQSLWQYLGIQELFAIIKAVAVGSLLLPFITFFMQAADLPRSILIIDWFLLIITLGGSRIFYKLGAERLRMPRFDHRKNVLIIGADDAGELLVREFIKQPGLGYRPAGFLDDSPEKMGVRIHGIKVLGRISQLAQVLKVKKVDEVIIASPRITGPEVKEIIKTCRRMNAVCRSIPPSSTILSQRILPLKLRPVDISDLLGRELVLADIPALQNFFRGKKVLITGAGGSIGSELARIIHEMHPREMILVDCSESNLYDIEMDLASKPSDTEVLCYLRDTSRTEDMRIIFERHHPEIVYHAAAYKHVPMIEMNYREGIVNNILGTQNITQLSAEFGADRFVLISTDKAIRPRSIMGATKRICELYAQSLKGGKTQFLAVRFGNVFNSRGSVVPLFKKQLEEGLPMTVTDPEVKRYFMDLSEAVFLILQATILGKESEIFMLDMGKAVKIVDLAREMAQLMGVPANAVKIRYTGLRPGEKMEEDLDMEREEALPTSHPKIRLLKMSGDQPGGLAQRIDELLHLVARQASRDEVIGKIKEIVPEYTPWRFPS